MLFEKTSETSLQHGISERERPEALTAPLSCWLLARFTSCVVVPKLGIACPWQLHLPADTRRRHGLSRASESQVFLAGQTRRDYSPFSSDLSPSLPPPTTGETRERFASVPDPSFLSPTSAQGRGTWHRRTLLGKPERVSRSKAQLSPGETIPGVQKGLTRRPWEPAC